jgi:hypothetical protein
MKLFSKKHKIILETTSGRKFCTLKFTNKEFDRILLSCKIENITLEEFFQNVIKQATKPGTTRVQSD